MQNICVNYGDILLRLRVRKLRKVREYEIFKSSDIPQRLRMRKAYRYFVNKLHCLN